MPVKNAGPWLEECLDSIINQTHKNWELIAVNDFSTDNSLEILTASAEADHRIRVLNNVKSGIPDALQIAFNNSTGTYITRMDADDIMPKDKLETLLKTVLKYPNTVVTGKVHYFAEYELTEGYQNYVDWVNNRIDKQDFEKHIFRECVVTSPNWLTHRNNILKTGPFNNHQYPEDYDLVFGFVSKGIKIRGVDKITHLLREHRLRTSRVSKNYSQANMYKLKLNWFLRLKLRKENTIVIFGENKKAKICAEFFSAINVEFVQLFKSNFKELSTIKNPLVLNTIYSDQETNDVIQEFFDSNHLILGENWWYV